MLTVLDRLCGHLDRHDPGGVLGAYLFGSSVIGGLRRDSDIDIAILTERSLSHDERAGLLDFLLRFSGRRGTVEPGRPLEFTSVVRKEVVPWAYPPVCDFQYGEWLRSEFTDGRVPQPYVGPDLAVLLTTVRQHSQVLRGSAPAELLEPVPLRDLNRAMGDSLDPLLEDLIGDERNVLLTLARMLFTVETGAIVAKDEAARRILPGLPESDQAVMSLAVAGYLGETDDDWSAREAEVQGVAGRLADQIRAVLGELASARRRTCRPHVGQRKT